MKSYEPNLLPHSQKKRCDIRIPHKYLGVFLYKFPIKLRQKLNGGISATGAKDGLNLVIQKHSVQIRKPVLFRPGHIVSVHGKCPRPQFGLKTKGFERL